MFLAILLVIVIMGALIGLNLADYFKNHQGTVLTVVGVVLCALLI